MNRLRDYTRLVRMYGGALQAEELGLDLTELINYRDKIIRLVPSVDIDARISASPPTITGLTSAQINLVKPLINKDPAFPSDSEFLAEWTERTAGLVILPKVDIILNSWSGKPIYGFPTSSTNLDVIQNWTLIKLVEVLERIDTLSKATTTRKVPPTAVARVGPPRASIPAFEEDLLKWLINDPPASKIPDDAAFQFNDDWAKVDVQTLEAHDALKDKAKVTLLINKLALLYTANPAINEAFGMQLGLLSTYEK